VLVTPRSGTCGADCRGTPCTLRDMRTAQHVLADDPAIVLWAELSTAAHLTGWASPVPAESLLETLRKMPARLRDCALSHAVDAAVASRAAVIAAGRPAVTPINQAYRRDHADRHGVRPCASARPT
jgi:uncharacterized protein